MDNYRFYAPTDIRFGKGELKALPELLACHGKNVLLTYGGGSIKKSGLYAEVMALLEGFNVFELSGIEPNPKITSVRAGVKLCKDNNIDVILAVGGGSTIDCSKVIGAGYYYAGDAWDLVINPAKIEKALPVVCVLTLAATGTEMNKNAVISDMDNNNKYGTASVEMIPKGAICDPTLTYSLPAIQTAAGTADIMSHVLENYFKADMDTMVQDGLAETLLKTCIKYCPIALKTPDNYEARAQLMWASTLALNGLVGAGKNGPWVCHPIEHELSAYYDITHGVGLAILTPRWMEYILSENTVDKFVTYANNVWGITGSDKFDVAKKGIKATFDFFKSCNIPMTLTEIGIDDTKFDIMAQKSVEIGGLNNAYVPLNKEDVVNILKMCL